LFNNNRKRSWISLGLLVLGIYFVGSWLIPGWSKAGLVLQSAAMDKPYVMVTSSSSQLETDGKCGDASCPGQSRNYLLYDYLDVHLPIVPRTPVVESLDVQDEVAHLRISFSGDSDKRLWIGMEKSNHWLLILKVRKGLIGGRTVLVDVVNPAE
jgi:hypothetical protein